MCTTVHCRYCNGMGDRSNVIGYRQWKEELEYRFRILNWNGIIDNSSNGEIFCINKIVKGNGMRNRTVMKNVCRGSNCDSLERHFDTLRFLLLLTVLLSLIFTLSCSFIQPIECISIGNVIFNFFTGSIGIGRVHYYKGCRFSANTSRFEFLSLHSNTIILPFILVLIVKQ